MKARKQCLLEPTIVGDVQYSVHEVTGTLKRMLPLIFGDYKKLNLDRVYIVPIILKSKYGLTGDLSDKNLISEKDRLLEVFFSLGKQLKEKLGKLYWLDMIDPRSGNPTYGRNGSSIYSEVDGISKFLKYERMQIQGCEIVLHPIWKDSCYPASIFTDAPMKSLEVALEKLTKL